MVFNSIFTAGLYFVCYSPSGSGPNGNDLIRHAKLHCGQHGDKRVTNIWRHYKVLHKTKSDAFETCSHPRQIKEFAKTTDRYVSLVTGSPHKVGEIIVVVQQLWLMFGEELL